MSEHTHHLSFLLKGMIIGFSIAAPVGPIGVLCIRRSLAEGQRMGLLTGLGAASADAAYGCIAGFGLTAISRLLLAQQIWLGLVGGLFLCYLGVRTFLSNPTHRAAEVRASGLFSAYITTVLLTLTNPMTILSFMAVFAGLGLGKSPDYKTASTMVSGVFIGSALWWLLLSNLAAAFKSRFSSDWMRVVNRVSGAMILAFGLYSLSTVLLM